MPIKSTLNYGLTTQECIDYQPIETAKNFSLNNMEISEDTGCDTCAHYNNGKCKVHLK